MHCIPCLPADGAVLNDRATCPERRGLTWRRAVRADGQAVAMALMRTHRYYPVPGFWICDARFTPPSLVEHTMAGGSRKTSGISKAILSCDVLK